MADQVILKIAGKAWAGWTEVSVTRSLETLAATFSISLTERLPDSPEKREIEAGAPCEVWIGDDQLITGYADTVEPYVDGETHRITVEGRDKTADLVDCSAVHSPGSWRGRKLEQIASDLAQPYGITVAAKTSTGAAFARFALQPGESVFEAMDRMAKQRGVLLTTNAAGNVEIIRPGLQAAGYRLALGENLKSIGFRNDLSERFSIYKLKGHAAGQAALKGSKASRPAAEAKDAGVPRYRALVLVNEGGATPASMADRAKWEATTRAGKGQRVTAVVAGWRAANGELYRIDRLAPVAAPLVGVDRDLLVCGVTFSRGSRGSLTQLSLAPKEAFSLLAVPAKKGKGKGADALLKP
ncbi:MAG: bacteriophage Mu [Caulobacter sp.]|nr:bacteriophage Mu [Caulobacter sp.]